MTGVIVHHYKKNTLVQAVLIATWLPAILLAVAVRAPAYALVVEIVSLAHAVILGVPIFLCLRKWTVCNVFTATLAGFFIGLLPVSLAAWSISAFHLIFAGMGALSGCLFMLYLDWKTARDASPC